MYQRQQERQGGFGKGIIIFSISLVGFLVIGLGLAGVFGDDESTTTTAQVGPTKTMSPTVSEMEPAEIKPAVSKPAESKSEDVSGSSSTKVTLQAVTYGDAESAYLDRRYREALDLFTVYTEQHPKNPWGFYMYALSAWKSGENQDAEVGFQTALDLDPNHLKSYLNLARVLLEENRPQEALTQAQLAKEIDADHGETFRILGRAYHNLGETDLAVESYLTATTLDENDAWAANNMGLVLIQSGRFAEALSPLARATQLQPDRGVFQNNLGIALERSGHFTQATEAFQAALNTDETNEKILGNLDRVSALVESTDSVQVNLAELALGFKTGPLTTPGVPRRCHGQ